MIHQEIRQLWTAIKGKKKKKSCKPHYEKKSFKNSIISGREYLKCCDDLSHEGNSKNRGMQIMATITKLKSWDVKGY